MINDKKLIYLAGPYYHEDPKIRQKRFKLYTKLASKLISKKDVFVFSPITHGHPIAFTKTTYPDGVNGLEINRNWLLLGLHFLKQCDELWVVDLEGWKDSVGVKKEITEAELDSKPIRMVTIRGKVSKFKYEA